MAKAPETGSKLQGASAMDFRELQLAALNMGLLYQSSLIEESEQAIRLMDASQEEQQARQDTEKAYDVIAEARKQQGRTMGAGSSGVDGAIIELADVHSSREIHRKLLRALEEKAAEMRMRGFEISPEAQALINRLRAEQKDLSRRMAEFSKAGEVCGPVLKVSAGVRSQIVRILRMEEKIMDFEADPAQAHLPSRSYGHLAARLEKSRAQQEATKKPEMEAKLAHLLELAEELVKPGSYAWNKGQMFELCRKLKGGDMEEIEEFLAELNNKSRFAAEKTETETLFGKINSLIEEAMAFLRKEEPPKHYTRKLWSKSGKSGAYTDWLREYNRLREHIFDAFRDSHIGDDSKVDGSSEWNVISSGRKELLRIAAVYAKYVEAYALAAELGIGNGSYVQQIVDEQRCERMMKTLKALQGSSAAAATVAAPESSITPTAPRQSTGTP